MKYTVEHAGETCFPCECCGGTTRRVWGWLHPDAGDSSAYFVQWAEGQVDSHGAFFDFVIGRWGEGTTAADRSFAALEFRRLDTGPGFMVIDAAARGDHTSIAASALARAQVVGTPLAALLFELADAVWLQDERIRELTGGGPVDRGTST